MGHGSKLEITTPARRLAVCSATCCILNTAHPPRPRLPVGGIKEQSKRKTKHKPIIIVCSWLLVLGTRRMTAPNTLAQCRRCMDIREAATIPWGSITRRKSISLISMSFRIDGLHTTERLPSTEATTPMQPEHVLTFLIQITNACYIHNTLRRHVLL
jgi:hypothetical protein